jgi:two-component system sensor histidine kinase/response regulator
MNNTLLLVEDARSFAALVKGYIEDQLPFKVDHAANLAQVELYLAEGRQYFAAVVDLNLPDAPDGEAVNVVLNAEVPVIVFTSQFNPSLREDLLSRYVADYVLKQGMHNLDYIAKLLSRIRRNYDTSILIVDDSVSARLHLQRLLESQKYRIFVASNGNDALEILQQNPQVQLMITDAFMDGLDGFALCTQARKTHSRNQLAILGISGQSGQALSARFIKSGADDFLFKPYLPEELFCRLTQNIERIEQIQNLQKLNEQKNRLLGMAAHDIRNPLANIRSLVDLLPDSDRANSDAIVDLISQSCDQMLALLNDLLDISAIESGKLSLKLQSCDLAHIIGLQLQQQRHLAQRKHIQLNSQLSSCLPAMLDAQRIGQVIANLLNNAIKYSPTGSQVQILLKQTPCTAHIEVIDQGPGLSLEESLRLFKPFERLSSLPTAGESSTGLGLSICKNIIDAHQGTIGLRQHQGSGCHFYVELPLSPHKER